MFPKQIEKIIVPPIKCQGIKTKLVPFIANNIHWNESGVWFEPFLGSGVVLFNLQPQKAIVCDTNEHIIRFYQKIQENHINKENTRTFLEYHGQKLRELGQEYYYNIRKQFNEDADSLKFLFLNRACFNGMMRFNNKGEFNVPYCKKDNRFDKSYITKICNQIDNIQKIMKDKEWTFICCDWKDIVKNATTNDFVYLDPPYIGRDTNYFSKWSEEQADDMALYLQTINVNYAISMWKENKYRKNPYIETYWKNYEMKDCNHFYFLGGKEENRNKMIETLILKKAHS